MTVITVAAATWLIPLFFLSMPPEMLSPPLLGYESGERGASVATSSRLTERVGGELASVSVAAKTATAQRLQTTTAVRAEVGAQVPVGIGSQAEGFLPRDLPGDPRNSGGPAMPSARTPVARAMSGRPHRATGAES